jgi:hypothetical protein
MNIATTLRTFLPRHVYFRMLAVVQACIDSDYFLDIPNETEML